VTTTRCERELSIVAPAQEDAVRAMARLGPLLPPPHVLRAAHLVAWRMHEILLSRGVSWLQRAPGSRHGRAPRRRRSRRGAARRAASRGDPPEPAGRRRLAIDDNPSRNQAGFVAGPRHARAKRAFTVPLVRAMGTRS
jgi:hypothetical protein